MKAYLCCTVLTMIFMFTGMVESVRGDLDKATFFWVLAIYMRLESTSSYWQQEMKEYKAKQSKEQS